MIASAPAPLGGETTVIALDAALTAMGRFPALDLAASGHDAAGAAGRRRRRRGDRQGAGRGHRHALDKGVAGRGRVASPAPSATSHALHRGSRSDGRAPGTGSCRLSVKCHHSVASPLKPAAIIGSRSVAGCGGASSRGSASRRGARAGRSSRSPCPCRSCCRGSGCAARPAAVAQAVAAVVALLLAGRELDEREVHRAAAAVAGLGRDVALLEHPALAHARVELGLHRLVREVLAPLDEGVDRALRPVAVVDLERVALRPHDLLHAREPLGRLRREQAHVLAVAGDPPAHEVVVRQVAHLDDDRGVDVVERDERARRRLLDDVRARGRGEGEEKRGGPARTRRIAAATLPG